MSTWTHLLLIMKCRKLEKNLMWDCGIIEESFLCFGSGDATYKEAYEIRRSMGTKATEAFAERRVRVDPMAL